MVAIVTGVWAVLLQRGVLVNARFAECWRRRFAVVSGLTKRERLMRYAQNAGHDDWRIEEIVRGFFENAV